MKKYSEKHRRFLIRKSKAGTGLMGRQKARSELIAHYKNQVRLWRHELPETEWSLQNYSAYRSFLAPKNFSIFDNYTKTLAFLLDIRIGFAKISRRRKPTLADFSTIETLDPASGLLLAAEVDRWRRTQKRRPIALDTTWPINVRDFFHDAGLFELLNIDATTARSTPSTGTDLKTIRFRSDTLTQGAIADSFRQELEALVGESLGVPQQIYVALSEAMANVSNHAYPSGLAIRWPLAVRRRWWLGGSWSPGARVATVQMYDQGVGIPRTLPKSEHWSEVFPILSLLDPERTDAGLIEAAMQYGRTSTAATGRGKGLAQMADWIKHSNGGSLRILSGRGALTFLPGRKPIRKDLPVEFGGTLVEWEVRL